MDFLFQKGTLRNIQFLLLKLLTRDHMRVSDCSYCEIVFQSTYLEFDMSINFYGNTIKPYVL